MKPTHSLSNYLRRGFTDRKSRLLSFLSPYKVAEDLFTEIEWNSIACESEFSEVSQNFKIQSADKRSPVSNPVFRYLDANPHPAIRTALLFGSLADGTACPYSDFDGILVIDCSAIKSAVSLLRLRNIIVRSEEMMLDTDPLQHHGWHFVLIDAEQKIVGMDLPGEILEECKTIHPFHPIELQICGAVQPIDPMESYRHIVASIRKKLMDQRTLSCLYSFKTLCSEFMLVPALFLQAMSRPVSKKESFNVIGSHINSDKLAALRTVSEWRLNWKKPDMSTNIRLFHACKKRGIRLSFLLPAIPDAIRSSFPGWKTEAESFLSACDEKLEQHRFQS